MRWTEDGSYLGDLNAKSEEEELSKPTTADWDQTITGLQLDNKVNFIKRLGKFVICAFHNSRTCIFNLQKKKKRPSAVYEHYTDGHVKAALVENSMVFMLVHQAKKKKSKKQDDNDVDKRPELIVWIPTFKKKEAAKEFESLSEAMPLVSFN